MKLTRTTTTHHMVFIDFYFHFLACPDLNFALYVLYIYSCCMKPIQDRNTEPEEIDQSQ